MGSISGLKDYKGFISVSLYLLSPICADNYT